MDIFTTKGFLPREQLELVESVYEDADKKVIRTDKFLASTREWVGNDVHVIMKTGLPLDFSQGTIG